MSLHALAQHMQQAGRGDDKMLVHMTPGEVGGLQALAMAHGGSLTVNPETGLPEAGFLSSILPMVAGAALSATGIGAPMAAALVGGAGALATGNLGKGLMMGLGAYGGAGLGAGLMGAGMDAAAAGVAAPALTADAAANAALLGEGAGAAVANPAGSMSGSLFADKVAAAQAAAAETPFKTAFEGLKSLGTEGGRAAFMQGMGSVPYSTYASLGSTAMGNYYDQLDKMNELAGARGKSKSLIRPYTLEREYSSEPDAYGRYFQDTWTEGTPYAAPGPEYAGGGLLAFADGGMPVEQMSRMNAIGANTRYPMASQTTSTYATPAERPISENVINPPGYTPVDPYTGAERFAAGGGAGIGSIYDQANKSSSASSKTSAPKPGSYDTAKKIVDDTMLQDIYARMGGVGKVPEKLKNTLLGNKRSEADIVNTFKKDPYFSTKDFLSTPGISKELGLSTRVKSLLTEEDKAKIEQAKTDRINSVAQAQLGRNATPEELAKLRSASISLAGMGDWFAKNAKDEYGTYQQKAFDERQKAATEAATAKEKTAFEQDPKNWASASQTANIFRQTFGRAPTAAELQQYSGMNMTPEKLKEAMTKSDLYTKRLTGETSGVSTPKFTRDEKTGIMSLPGAMSPYQSATDRLGLGQFYGDMDAALKKQMLTAGDGMKFAAPAKQTNLSALDQYYAPAGTNIAQGSAEQAQLASLLAAQNVAQQASMYGIGPTVARAGAPGISAPRFTSSGNIYSAGYYSPQYGSTTQPQAVTTPTMGYTNPAFTGFPTPPAPAPTAPMASGGIASLGDYSDGGRLLKGPGDGVSDSIPASIGERRPARLADGEFVIPARIVSELGNGSTEAGARQLYAMMDRVQKARRKTVGKKKVAVDSKASKMLPA